MLRAAMDAGQFVHLSEENIGACLDTLYVLKFRLEMQDYLDHRQSERYGIDRDRYFYDEEICTLAERAVPISLVKLVKRSGRPQYFEAETLNYIARHLGICCSLCLRTDWHPEWCHGETMEAFWQITSPNYLRPTVWRRNSGGPAAQPLCSNCNETLFKFYCKLKRTDHGRELTQPYLLEVTLAKLLTNTGFRERIRRFASIASELRFDPRIERPIGTENTLAA